MPFLLPAAATAVAAAAPAAVAATASASLASTIATVAMNAAANLAISAVMSALQPQVGAAGRVSEWTLDPDGPIPFAAGRVGVPGAVVYRKTFGPDQMYYGIPSVLSGSGPIDGYEAFKADDENVAFDGNGKAVSSQYAGELWYRRTMGNQPDVAVTSPPGLKNNATLPGWGAQHKLSGKAAYMIVMGENSKGTAYPTGEIKPLITLRGLRGWDPRFDSTYPGGVGACRLDNPATWVYLTNPILWALKWSLGLWEGPVGKGAPQVDYQVGGIGAKLSGIDVPAFVAAANIADANGWTVSAYPTTDDDKAQVLDAFLQAGGAVYAQRAGKISCIQRAAPRTSIVTISAADTAGPIEMDTAASRIDRINTIRPRFWSEAHRWQLTALPEVTALAYRDEDGGTRPRPLDYPYVSKAQQAKQLAALQIANTREGIAGVIPLKPYLQRIRPGDAFTITEPGFVLNGVKCLCLATDYDPATGIVSVTFVSETDAKYPFAMGQSPDAPVPPVLEPVDPTYVSPPGETEWAVIIRPPSDGGAQIPGFDLIGEVDNATATALLVEWGPTAEGPWTQAYLGPPTAERIPLTGIQANAVYYVSTTNVRGQNYSQRRVYGPFTAPPLISDDSVNTGGQPSDEVAANAMQFPSLAAQTGALELAVAAAQGQIADHQATLYTATTGLVDRTNAILSTLNTPTTGVLARLTAVETSSSNDNAAAVSRLNALEATVNTPTTGLSAVVANHSSAISNLQTGKADASTVSALQAQISTPTTGILARLTAQEAASANLLTGKADASRVALIEASVASLGADRITEPTGANWTRSADANPAPAVGASFVASDALGYYVTFLSSASIAAQPLTKIEPGRQYRATVQFEQQGAADSGRWAYFYFDAAGVFVTAAGLTTVSFPVGSYERTETFGLAGSGANIILPPGAIYARAVWQAARTSAPGGSVRIRRLSPLVDVTETQVAAGKIATLETATANLQTGKADVATVTALSAQINQSGTGLLARMTAAETASANLQTGKADVATVTALEVTAKVTAAKSFPYGFDNEGATWINSYGGAETTAIPAGTADGRSYPAIAGVGKVMQIALPAAVTVDTSTMGLMKIQRGHRYRTSIRARRVSGGNNATATAYLVGLDAAYGLAAAGSRAALTITLTTNNQWYEAVVELDGNAMLDNGAVWLRGMSRMYAGTLATSVQVDYCKLDDITEPAALDARLTTAETAVTDLQAGKADASTVSALQAQISTPTTGILARLTSAETATANLQTGKADVSAVTALEAKVGGVIVAGGNQGFEAGLDGWAATYEGANLPSASITWLDRFSGREGVARAAVGYRGAFFTRKRFDVDPARKYRVRARAYIPGGASTGVAKFYAGFRALDVNGAASASNNNYVAVAGQTYPAGTGWKDFVSDVVTGEGEYTSSTNLHFPTGTRSIVLMAYVNYDQNPTMFTYLDGIWLEDVTETEALGASVTSLQLAMASMEGRVEARAVLQVQAGNQIVGVQFLAVDGPDASYGTVDFWAGVFRVSNNGGSPTAPFEIRGDVVRMKAAMIDRLSVGTAISVGPFGFPVALEAKLQPAKDGEVVSYGGDLGQVPNIVWPTTGLDPLNDGESYLQYAENHTSTGFIARRKIQTPATPSAYNLTTTAAGPGTDTAGSTGPARIIERGANPVSVDNTYLISGGGVIVFRTKAEPGPVQEGTLVLRVWQRISGVWSAIGFLYCYALGDDALGAGSGSYTYDVPTGASDSFTCSTTVEAWGLSLYSRTGGVNATRSNTMSVQYTAQGAGAGVRTATSGNQRPNIEIRLKNAA